MADKESNRSDLITCFHSMRQLNPVYRYRMQHAIGYTAVTRASEASGGKARGLSAPTQQVLEGLDLALVGRSRSETASRGPRIGGVRRWVVAVVRAAHRLSEGATLEPGGVEIVDELVKGHCIWWCARDTMLSRWWSKGAWSVPHYKHIGGLGVEWYWNHGKRELEEELSRTEA